MSFRSIYRLTAALLLILTQLLLAREGWAQASEAPRWQDLSQVPQQARDYLTQRLQARHPHDSIEVKVSSLDPRLRLAHCDKPLTYEEHSRSRGASNVTLKVGCPGPVNWSFYLTTELKQLRTVVVAGRDIGRGEQVSEAALSHQKLDISSLGHGVVVDPGRIIGLEVKRPIRRGESIRMTSLTQPRVINRGDQVAISAVSDSISVATDGLALSDGKVGEQIRVRNSKTDRIIRARVTGRGQVEVRL